MKKMKSVLMVLAVVSTVAIYSCGGNQPAESTEPATEQVADSVAAPVADSAAVEAPAAQ